MTGVQTCLFRSCFGPSETPDVEGMVALLRTQGVDAAEIERLFHTFNAWSEPFRRIPVDAPTRKTTGLTA